MYAGQSMDASAILKELYDERETIDEAIAALEALASSRGKRGPGRPPKWMKEAKERLGKSKKKS